MLIAVGALAMAGLVWWLVRRKRQGQPMLLDPDLFQSKVFRFGITGQMLQQIALGGTMIVLPIYLQMVLEYSAMAAGLSLAPLSLSMFAVALVAGKKAGTYGRAGSSVGASPSSRSAWSSSSPSCRGSTPVGTCWCLCSSRDPDSACSCPS